MAAAAIAASAIGNTLTAVGQIREGNAAYAAAQYNANADRQNAAQAVQQADEEQRRQKLSARKQFGNIRSSVGASGIQLDGSALDVLQESAATAELDSLSIKHQGQAKAQAFENNATLEMFRGKNARTAGYLGAASTLIKAGGSAAGSASSGGGEAAPKRTS